ncbi:hypothetical protein [Primorskyibacter flagellatus]|nr:hypothetical protein [Primorskyibacter flagellatus]
MTEETYGGPFFIPEGTSDPLGITTSAAARALADAGFPASKATIAFRNLVAAGRVHPYHRQVSDARKPYLFRADQVMAAAVMIRMNEAGFRGDGPFNAAESALNDWNVRDLAGAQAPAPRPVAWAFRCLMEGHRGFGFELRIGRCMKSGRVEHSARIRHVASDTGTNWHFSPTVVERSTWLTDLDSIFDHLSREKAIH